MINTIFSNGTRQEKNKTNYRQPKDHVRYNKKRKRRRGNKKYNAKTWWSLPRPVPFVSGRQGLWNFLKRSTESRRRILSYLIYMDSRGVVMYMSQEYIARALGYSRQTVNREINILRQMGFVDFYWRKHRTCVYKLTGLFRQRHIQESLGPWLPILRTLFLCLISAYKVVSNPLPSEFTYSLYGARFRDHFTVIKNKENNNNNYNVSDTNNFHKGEQFLTHLLNKVNREPKKVYGDPKKDTYMQAKRYKPERQPVKQTIPELNNHNFQHKQNFQHMQAAQNNALLQQAKNHSKEKETRLAYLEFEKETDAYKANMVQANENLKKLFGGTW